MEEITAIHEACKALAACCDGARERDRAGFNKLDTYFGKQLAYQNSLTPGQARAAHRMLCKYQTQLAGMGINYNALIPPAIPAPAPKRLVANDKAFVFSFPYSYDLKERIKELKARWNPNLKVWSVFATAGNVEAVLTFALTEGFDVDESVPALVESLHQQEEAKGQAIEASKAQEAPTGFAVTGLGGTLRPFQEAGVSYALKAQRCFIADEMGLGKTVQALALVHAARAYPALIVCPASLKLNWEREARHWLLGVSTSILNGKAPDLSAQVLIINYDILSKWGEALKAVGLKAIIFDESHYLKNYKAKRTKEAKELAKGVPIRLALTGTYILNRPYEAISQLEVLSRLEDVGGFWYATKRYCNAYKGRFGWDFTGASNLPEFNQRLRSSCFVRRTKAEVLAELPAKQRTTLPLEIDNRAEYDRAETDLITWLREQAVQDEEFTASIRFLSPKEQGQKRAERADSVEDRARRAEHLVRIEALKQVAVKGKLAGIKEWIDSFLESEEKLIVFAHHKAVVAEVAAVYNAPSITGDTPILARQAAVDKFQTDPTCRVIALNMQAGGVGLTLTAASNVAFLELGWTPSVHSQAEDRAHRIGQREQVNCWYLLAAGTIDEEIARLIEKKRAVVDAATEGHETENAQGILTELTEALLAKKGR